MIHINLNIFCTHVEHSSTKTIYIKYYMDSHTHTHTHTRRSTDYIYTKLKLNQRLTSAVLVSAVVEASLADRGLAVHRKNPGLFAGPTMQGWPGGVLQ